MTELDLKPPNFAKRISWYWPLGIFTVILILIISVFPTTTANSNTVKINSKLLGIAYAGKPGITAGGYRCGPGIRQVPWSKYAPLCEPIWHGNNGGSSAPGVNASTITITYRSPNTAGASVLQNLFGAGLGTNQEAIETMKGYIQIFNKTFELYNRHVVLKPFNGAGDFINELEGQGLEQAQQDALKAKRLNAFADVSLVGSTQIYDQYLANQHIISVGAIAQPTYWFKAYAPYAYSPNATCDTGVEHLATGLGRAFANLPAIFSSSPAMQKKTRVFGLIFPNDPTYAYCGNLLAKLMSQNYHVSIKKIIEYSINLGQEETEAKNTILQFQAEGVTTVLCGCDPIFPILLSIDAFTQNYFPEWLALDFEDVFSQYNQPQEWEHAITTGLSLPPKNQQEAYKVYYQYFHKPPPSPQYWAIYEPLLLLFDALQAAGPDLTPYTFEQGFFGLPPSLSAGDYGQWKFGPGIFSPVSSYEVLQWDEHAISVQDNKLGTYVPCFNGKIFTLNSGPNSLPLHKQVACPSDS